MSPRRRPARLVLKLAFSAAAIGYLAASGRLRPAGVAELAAGAAPGLLALGLALHVVGITLSALRWRYLLLAQGTDIDLPTLARYILVASFFNVFLPTSVGGDVVRVIDSRRAGSSYVRPAAVILIERASGLLTLLAFAAVVLALRLPVGFEVEGRLPAAWLAAGYGAGLALLAGLLLAPPVARLSLRLFELPGLRRLQRPVAEFRQAVLSYRDRPGLLVRALATGAVLQVNYVLYYVVVARALGITAAVAPLAFFFLVIPIRDVLLLLPFFINGIGIREISDVTFFAWIGLGSARAIAFSWVSWALALAFAALGGVVFVLRRRECPR